MTDDNTTFSQQVLNISQAQAETEVQPDCILDDFWREAVAFEARRILTFYHHEHLELG